MADRLICPVCGESNPTDMEFCRNCQSRLQPLTGPLKGESGAIQPGEPPTKKVTSELEPLLPQWLRDARQQARDTAAEDLEAAGREQQAPAGPTAPDLLDGLASQSAEEDEDIPDWLSQITGATSKKKKPAEDTQVKRVELGHDRPVLPVDGVSSVPPGMQASTRGQGKDELSDWFKQAAASAETADFRMPKPPASEPAAAPAPEEAPAQPGPQPPAEDRSWLTGLGSEAGLPSEASAESVPPREEAPDWLKKLQAEQAPPPAPPAPSPAPQADVPDWLRQFGEAPASAQPVEPSPAEPLPADLGVPDWLKELPAAATDSPAAEPPAAEPAATEAAIPADLPDWISSLGTGQPAAQEEVQPSASEPISPAELPDWISSLGAEQEALQASQLPPAGNEPVPPAELPDWISTLGAEQAPAETSATQQPEASGSVPPAELPDWISSLGMEQPAPQAPEAQEMPGEAIPPAEPPDWISSLGAEQVTPPAADAEAAANEALPPFDIPDWLSSVGADQAAPPATEPSPAPEETIAPAELPDWLSSLGAEQPPDHKREPAGLETELPASLEPAAPEASSSAPLPVPEPPAAEDVDAVFASMQTPDWLSAVLPPASEEPSGSEPAAAQPAEEPIGPAELPSWVQAMRPVESVMTPSAGVEEDFVTEKRGPLAGLQGVLPSIPGAGEPSSKPRPQSFKLNASEQQLAHAALLERILAAETSPIPMKTGAILRSQKMLRWFISLLLLLVLTGIVFGGTQLFALPSGVPNETVAAISAVEAIPPDAPVLVVFDYQPSTVGEMEAAGGPLLDHMLLLNHPRLALLSTSPTGSALAERFMSTVLAGRGYVRDQQYVDLGYLPGGLAGVYNFAQNPLATVPLDAQLRAAWQSSFLTSVQNFSDFAAVIVLTDSIESGRTWVEQTAVARGKTAMVLVASAQAGPMLLPYVDSGQVNGLVSGLYGAVGVEQRNAGSPGLVRRYWDAYSVGLYLAVVLITLGALWSLWIGIRERRTQAVG